MTQILNLGYLVVASPEPESWRKFGMEVVGAMDSSLPSSDLGLKIDEHPFRILIEESNADRLVAMGLEVASREALEAMRERLINAGITIQNGTQELAAKRCVTDYFSATDPAGNPIEIYYGRTQCGEPFVSPIGVSGFVTGDMGLGHLVVPAAGCFDDTHAFYTAVLGFGDSDDLTIAPPAEGAPELRVKFMHAANPRHHSLALFNMPSPTGITHIMLEMENIDEVGRCLDRAMSNNMTLMASLGRHCNDNMLSFYVNARTGVPVEIGCDGLRLDWDTFEPTVSTTPDIWGHAYNLG